jgi:hypothetical protein
MVRFPNGVATDTFDATKAPGELLPYNINWSDMLAAGESILTSVWIIVDNALINISDPAISGLETTTKVSGGAAGYNYVISNTITTSNGNTCVRRFNIKVKEK